MTTPPIGRRRTAQQILLRRACQTKCVNKSQDAAEVSVKNRNGEKGCIMVLPSMGRALGLTQERSPTRPVVKRRRVPAVSTFVVSGERKTAGKLTIGETLKEDSVSCKKQKSNEEKRSPSGQRSGYTSRGSTKSVNSNSYPSKWPKNFIQEEDTNVNSKGSLEEITKCSPLNRTPYDHNLNTPLKSADSSQCPPIKKNTRRASLKTAAISGAQAQSKPQSGKTDHIRVSSQSNGAKMGRRAYSGEEDGYLRCPSKSSSATSNNFCKCKLNPGVTFKNYGGYSPSGTEFSTLTEGNRQFRCSDSFYNKIDNVSRPPSMYFKNGVWSLELASEMEMQEFLSRAGQEDHCGLCDVKSGESERKSRLERVGCKCFNRNDSYCKCSTLAVEEDLGRGNSRRSPEEPCKSSSRNSVRFRCREWNENDYAGHGSPREKGYHMETPCDECRYIRKQSSGCESGLGTGGSRRDPNNCPCRSRPSRPAYTMGACWDSHGPGSYGRGASEAEYECKPNEAFANRNCTEAITQTSKIVMTKRIDESASHCSPICCCFQENTGSQLSSSRQPDINSSLNHITDPKCKKDEFCGPKLNAQSRAVEKTGSRSSKQEQCYSEQKSKHSAISGVNQSHHKPNSAEKVNLPSCPPCQQKLSPPSAPAKQALPPLSPKGSSNSHQLDCRQSSSRHTCLCNQPKSHLSPKNLSDKDGPSATASLCGSNQGKANIGKRKIRYPSKKVRSPSSSAKKDVNSCKPCFSNERRTRSNEEGYKKGSIQMEDQCDVIKILSILQKTVAGLEEEIKKAKASESGRSSRKSSKPRRKKRVQCEQKSSNLSQKSRSSSLCPPSSQQVFSPAKTTYQNEMPSSCPPCQQEVSPLSPPCQQELSPNNPTYQQEMYSSIPPGQQELPPSSPPGNQELPSSSGLSQARPFCQQRSSPSNLPHQQGWASSYQPHKCHHCSCPYSNAYSQQNNGAVSFGRPINPYQTNNPYKYGVHSTSINQDRNAKPLTYNWNQTNQRCLNTAYRNNQDLGMATGFTRAEQNYPAYMNGRKTHMYPYSQPTYATNFKNNRSVNDPEGHSTFPYTNWFRNNQQIGVSPGNPLAKNQVAEPRYGKCSMDATQLGNQDTINQVTFQQTPRAQCYQTNSNFPYGNFFGEMKTGLIGQHKKTCKAPQNVGNSRKEVCYQKSDTKSSEDCANSNSSDQCLENIQAIELDVLENKNCRDQISRNRQDIDSKPCENPNCPYRLQRNKREIDLVDCENPNCPYRFKRNRLAIDLEVCKNPNCPYRFPKNREDVDFKVCDNPNCPYRFPRNREDVDFKVCDNPKCPYRFPRSRDDTDSKVCENPNCPYRFKKTKKDIDFLEVCESPNCPYKFPRNVKDIDLVCENPNCQYRTQRDRIETDSEAYEYPNTSDRLKRAPNVKIKCNNPKCPNKLTRACAIPCNETSDSISSENSQDSCEELSSSASCPNHCSPVVKNKMWLRGGFESFESNEWGHRYEPFDKTNIPFGEQPLSCNRNRYNPFLTPDPILNSYDKNILKNYQKHKIEKCKARNPIKVCPAVCRPKNQACPRNYNFNRSGPKKTSECYPKQNYGNGIYNGQLPLYNYDQCYPKSTFSNCSCSKPQRITNCQDSPRGRPHSQREQPADICCKQYKYISETERHRNYDKAASKSSLFACCKKKERSKNDDKTTAKSSLFSCCKKKDKPPPQNREKNISEEWCTECTSKSSALSCYTKKEKTAFFQSENYCEECANYETDNEPQNEKAKSKSRGLPCCKKKAKVAPPKENDLQTKKKKSKLGGLLCCKKKEKQISDQYENYGKNECGNFETENEPPYEKPKSKSSRFSCCKKKEKRNDEQENDSLSERSKSKSKGFSCCKKKEKGLGNAEIDSQIEKNKSKSSLFSCCKKKEKERRNVEEENDKPKSKSSRFSCCKKKEKRNVERENDSLSERTKSKSSGFSCCKKKDKGRENADYDSQIEKNKSKSSGFSCCKKKEKGRRNVEEENEPPYDKPKWKSSRFSCCKKKEKRNVEQENDSLSEGTKSKSKGFSCCKKKDKGRKNTENDSQMEKTKSKSSGFLCFKKKEKPEEKCCEQERSKSAENENEIPKEGKKKSSCLKVFPSCKRKPKNKDKEDDISEHQEKTKKQSKLTKCFSCCRKSKTRKEPSNQIEDCEECRKYQLTCPDDNEEVRVLYDSRFRFSQESCSCFAMSEKTYCNNPQKGSYKEQENRQRQRECGNGFYKIGQ